MAWAPWPWAPGCGLLALRRQLLACVLRVCGLEGGWLGGCSGRQANCAPPTISSTELHLRISLRAGQPVPHLWRRSHQGADECLPHRGPAHREPGAETRKYNYCHLKSSTGCLHSFPIEDLPIESRVRKCTWRCCFKKLNRVHVVPSASKTCPSRARWAVRSVTLGCLWFSLFILRTGPAHREQVGG